MVGVNYDKSKKKWSARKTVAGKRIPIGTYRTEKEAIKALSMFTKELEKSQDGDRFYAHAMKFEETRSSSVFTRIKGWRFKRHKV